VNILLIHALGDAISPAVLGWLSDSYGIRKALLLTPIMILLAAFFCFVCSKYIEEDSAQTMEGNLS
jgi:MFS family permease